MDPAVSTIQEKTASNSPGRIARIARYMIHDGPGIRTVVFTKGCPLRCVWCSSPQTWSPLPQIIFRKQRCIHCELCLRACPSGAIEATPEGKNILRDRCQNCGRCAEACVTGALGFDGLLMSADEVFRRIARDERFYQSSGGGVTISGGEPLQQAEFVSEILQRCRQRGFHTALETSGYGGWESFQAVLQHVDLLQIDLKHMDAQEHLRLTSKSNDLILKNIRRAAKLGIPTMIRFPVIPGANDSRENIAAMISFLEENRIQHVDVFPFHKLGEHEYAELGLDYSERQRGLPAKEDILRLKITFRSHGLVVPD